MKIWLDAHLSPSLARFIELNLGTQCIHLRELGLIDACNKEIFQAARKANAIVMTQDSDFRDLLVRFGPPPQLIWITVGNSSNEKMRIILNSHLSQALALIAGGEMLVEITGR